jgi:putative acetyltransferase
MSKIFRKVNQSDLKQLTKLYKKSTSVKNGLARTPQEITKKYMQETLEKTLQNGLGIVIEEESSKNLIGALLSFKFEAKAFRHTLGNMTMAIDPSHLGKGLGKQIFLNFLQEVRQNRPEIFRVELNVRQNNPYAIKIYEEVGFKLEGIMKNRILDDQGNLSDDSFMAWVNPMFKKAE